MPVKAYTYTEGSFKVTPEVKADFNQKGYILVRNLLNNDELKKIQAHLEYGDVIKKYAYGVDDGASRKSMMCLWNQPGNDLTGMLARCEKVATTCDELLGGEVYHYHTKLMMKEAQTGGRWAWHQDYGYWYLNTCLFPDMMTVFIALDPCHQDNGCLQVMEGSHKAGRIEHRVSGEQTGANKERVEQMQGRCPPTFVEMEPGDALFFHCNLLHSSSQNNSSNRRWALALAYNRADNNPIKEHHHPQYTKLNKVPNSAILSSGDEWDEANKSWFTQDMLTKHTEMLTNASK